MTASKSAVSAIADHLRDALTTNALPGEIEHFTPDEQEEAAQFIAALADRRLPGQLAMRIESTGGEAGQRRMRLAIVNDDMPFLVDSVAGAIANRGLAIHRLLHPLIDIERDGDGKITAFGRGNRESVIYIELDRADARGRHELQEELQQVLTDVRAAVGDWKAMVAEMEADAATLDARDAESAALLRWFADNNFTLLGHATVDGGHQLAGGLGILKRSLALWDEAAARAAIDALASEQRDLLILKADRISPVHRRVPLDVIMVRRGDGGTSVHCGLWTSAALRSPAEDVPVLRQRLEKLDKDLGFSPASHGGKALTHAVSTLPHDLLISFAPGEVRKAALTAMSLADRPRPTLLLLSGALKRHLFSFVWLPRDELSTTRRLAIADMLEKAVGAPISNWAVELGDGDLALLRFTMKIDPTTRLPDVEALDDELVKMVRGWAPEVESALVEAVGSARATRMALTFLSAFPEVYRARTRPEDAAADIVRLCALNGRDARDARLFQVAGDDRAHLHLKIYRSGGLIPLSDAVPVLENFGFRVLEEHPTALANGSGYIHNFHLELPVGTAIEPIMERSATVEAAVSSVLAGTSENDPFNQLVLFAGVDPQAVVWLRAWFRYLRQTGVAFSIQTVVEALRRAPGATRALIGLFAASHDPSIKSGRKARMAEQDEAFKDALRSVGAIDDDRILRLMRSVVGATLRTNAYSPASDEALAFKIDSAQVPGLPAPVPYREIWVYSPRLEGIHLRGGPIARGGLRWSDRRDDFRTEILGLMKAQLVKNAVIVPTGAKGGFYPKQLPNPAIDRDAWFKEGTESYKIFIRSLLSVTDNIVNDEVVHPDSVVIHDGDDPYFVVAADKGTATFSDVANAIALEKGFWLGDAFASGGSNGYDHKAMGITAKGAWISVQRHFLEMGIDVQSEPVKVAGCGDMSGDVFGNGMLLSKSIKLIAAFDHRHIFIDPDPDAAASWAERERMFNLPRSSWDDYDRSKLSKGAMIVPRSQKSIELTAEAKTALGLDVDTIDPTSLITAILKSPVDLLWFGGIGTYIKASSQSDAQVGDPANDGLRVDAIDVRAKVLGEGANLAITQAGRIEFADNGGRINTDFIDNSAGVDCSDNEVNIKIPLNREMREGRLEEGVRNSLLERMTDEVSALVLEDNRLQSLALSIAEAGGASALPAYVRTIEQLEASGRLDRRVEGLAASDALLRRAGEGRGLTRPELAVVLSMSKLSLQAAAEALKLGEEPEMEGELFAAFPTEMQEKHGDAIRQHRLRNEIVATKVANRIVNRLGPAAAHALMEEEGAALGQVVAAFLVAERLLNLKPLWASIETAKISEQARIELFAVASRSIVTHLSDILRSGGDTDLAALAETYQQGVSAIGEKASTLIRSEVRSEAAARREQLLGTGAEPALVEALVRLYELDGVFGLAALSNRKGCDEVAITRAYTRLGEALGLDWAQQQVARFQPTDQWERLLLAGLARDFEQLRIDFLSRAKCEDPEGTVERWVERQKPRIDQFRRLVERAKLSGTPSTAMLAQLASQARILLAR